MLFEFAAFILLIAILHQVRATRARLSSVEGQLAAIDATLLHGPGEARNEGLAVSRSAARPVPNPATSPPAAAPAFPPAAIDPQPA